MKTETTTRIFSIKPPAAVFAQPAGESGRQLTLALLSTSFFALGLLTAALGPALNDLARNAGTSH